MTQRQQPVQQPPPVQRIRLRYVKRGRARFTSSRDFSRAFERALRRAGVPMAYSSGFSPHPRISYANGAPTGAATEAEYLEIGLASRRDPAWARQALSEALPEGLLIVEAVEASGPPLAELLTASQWLVPCEGVAEDVLAGAVAGLLASEDVSVERAGRGGAMRRFDVRAALLALEPAGAGALRMILAHTVPQVRPGDVLVALAQLEPAVAAVEPGLTTRLAQGIWDGRRLVGPFETPSLS